LENNLKPGNMKTKIIFSLFLCLLITRIQAQIFHLVERIVVVNMTNNDQSNEIYRDAEPNIAVDPVNTSHIVATAFTYNPTGATDLAPIYISEDRGLNWAINNKVPSTDGRVYDISVAFSDRNHTLYAGILKTGLTSLMTYRDANPFNTSTMVLAHDLSGANRDQPYPEAISRNDGGVLKDNVYVGFNDLSLSKSASCDKSNDARTAPAPAGFSANPIEVRNTCGQDGPPVRFTAHSSGVIYGAFVAWTSKTYDDGTVRSFRSDIVVVRDDNFGLGTSPFTALKDPSDSMAGRFVVKDVTTNFCSSAYLGKQRGALGISVGVNPANSADVWIAWLDSVTIGGKVCLHVRRSTTSGKKWSNSDLLTVNNAINPSIAVNSNGVCAVLYQRLNGTTWETHVQRSSNGTSWSDLILSTFDNGNANIPTANPLGDYTDMVAVGSTFYGVFSALNIPDNANFPHGVIYLRNADFTTHQLRNLANTANITPSIDPFFFKIIPGWVVLNFCDLHPDICKLIKVDKKIIRFPPYPCLTCQWPCLNCPPFEVPIEEIYKITFEGKKPGTVLDRPYFHLLLEGYNPEDFELAIVTPEGDPVAQELNRTEKGYSISFLPSGKYFSSETGLHGLKLIATPKNAKAAKEGISIGYQLKAADYRFKQFILMNQ
jgi:hypothetical protein